MADMFRQQIRFYGKHGQYLELLTPSQDNKNNVELPDIERNKYLFESVVEVYTIAPIVGYLYQRKAPRDGTEQTKSIMENALSNHHARLMFSYQLLMILDKQSEPDLNERIRRAFGATDKLITEGLVVFNDYARGGIEVLYEKLRDGAATPDDLMRNIMDFTQEWDEHFLAPDKELDLDDLLKH